MVTLFNSLKNNSIVRKLHLFVDLPDFQITAKNVNDIGALCPQFDRPEQGLDLLQEGINGAGLTPGEDIFIAINCAAHEIFDYVSSNEVISLFGQV